MRVSWPGHPRYLKIIIKKSAIYHAKLMPYVIQCFKKQCLRGEVLDSSFNTNSLLHSSHIYIYIKERNKSMVQVLIVINL